MEIKKTIILDSHKDWDQWIDVTRATAIQARVWKYIDPSKEEVGKIPEIPKEPEPSDYQQLATRSNELFKDNLEAFRWDTNRYDRKMQEIEKIEIGIGKVMKEIMATITPRTHSYIKGKQEVHNILKTLQSRFAPSIEAAEMCLWAEYQAVQVYTKKENIEDWLRRWEEVYNQAVEKKRPEVLGDRPIQDLLKAIAAYDAVWTAGHKGAYNHSKIKGDPLTLNELLEIFRQELQSRRSLHPTLNTHSAFMTDFKGRRRDGRSVNPNPESQPKCVCGGRHEIPRC